MFFVRNITKGVGQSEGITITVQWFLLALTSSLLVIQFLQKKKKDGNLQEKSRRPIPGPGQHLLGSLANIFALRNPRTFVKVFEQWAAKYGPIYQVHFGPVPVTFLNSPQYLQKLLGSNDQNHFSKGFAYEPLREYWKGGLVVSTGEKWKSRRKLLTKHMFKYNTLLGYMKIFNRESDRLLTTLKEMYKDGQSKPMEHEMMSFSLNVMTKVALGLRLTEVDKIIGEVPNTDFLSLVNKTKEVMCTRILNPWLLLKPIWRLHPLSNLTEIVSFVGRRVVTESFKWVGNHVDDDTRGLQHFLQNSGVEFDGVYEESLTVISAGYETTASSLHFLLFFLALHPNHQEQCRQEIDAVFEDVDFCSNSQSFIHYDALAELKHLEMCVSETLRLHPNAFLLMRKIEAELELDEDLILPANTNVGIFIPGIHKNPELYPNPEKFIPERFLKEETSNRHSYAYIPFSAGPRKCIGYKFAIMEMMTATAKILRNFHISTSSKLEEVVLLPHITLTPEKPMDFVLTKRKL